MFDQIIVLVILILLSGFFSGVEIALFSLSKLKLRHMVEKKVMNAHIIQKLKDNPQRLLITILIGNNVVNILASVYATTVAISMSESNVVGIVTGVMTFLILVFGEIIPKSVATTHSQIISQIVAKPILWMQYLLFPLIIVFEVIAKLGTLVFGKKDIPIVTEEEVKSIIAAGEEEGEIKEAEKEMIERVFKFDDVSADEIMTPRNDMIVVSRKASLSEAVKKMMRSGFSRLPVYEKTRDKIVGIVHLKDVVDVMKNKKKKVETIMKEPDFVPESKKTDNLLKHFQRKKSHMSLVVDEHGIVQGLVTLEDVLEEIVGEILDERDKVEPDLTKIKRNEWLVMGKMDVDDFFKKFKIRKVKEPDYETAGGYVISRLGFIPEKGDVLDLKNFRITVEEMKAQRLCSFKIVKK